MKKSTKHSVTLTALCLAVCCLVLHVCSQVGGGIVFASAIEFPSNAKPVTASSSIPYDRMEGGIQYKEFENTGDECYQGYDCPDGYMVSGFEQKYDTQGNPLYTDIAIPDEIDGKPVIGIDSNAFSSHSEIRSLTLGKNIVRIGYDSFYGCRAIKKIILPKSLRDIGPGAFSGCSGLTEIVIPKNVVIVDKNAFSECTSLQTVIFKGIPNTIYPDVFKGTKWLKICKRKRVAAISNKILIDASGLSGHVKITGKKVDRIVTGAFWNAVQITSLEIRGVQEISGAISGTGFSKSIRKVKLDHVERPQDNMLTNGKKLETVILGNKFSKIPAHCFSGCERLKHVYVYSNKVDASIRNAGISEEVVLHVPASAINRYKKMVSCKIVAL